MCYKSFLLIFIFIMLSDKSLCNDLKKKKVVAFHRSNIVNNHRYQHYKITFSDSWLGKDKADHFLVSAFLTAGCYFFLEEEKKYNKQTVIQRSVGFAFSIGLAKEIRDGFLTGRAGSIKDIVANVVGIGVTLLMYSEL